jgi:hypothetical protein
MPQDSIRTVRDSFDRGTLAVFKSAYGCLEPQAPSLALPGPHPALSWRERANRLSLAQELIKTLSFKSEAATMRHRLGDYFGQHGYEVLLQVTDVASVNILLLSDGSHLGKLCVDPWRSIGLHEGGKPLPANANEGLAIGR